jgi:hypothetical protein
MIVRDLASLGIWSEYRTAREMAEILGLEPTHSHERGDATRDAKNGTLRSGRSAVETRASWSLDGDANAADPEDETGFRTLRQLLSRISDKGTAIAELKIDCEVSITWSGYSDSWQGGFVLEEELLTELGRLGNPIWGTTYLDDGADEDSEDGWTSSQAGMLRATRVAFRAAPTPRLLMRILRPHRPPPS